MQQNVPIVNSTKEEPLISVIVPVYNAEKYIKKALLSILNQTYKNLEIICVDDGSKDNSLPIVRELAKNDKRIRVFTQENSGPAKARNVGLNNARGEYISFIDADDFIEAEAYAYLVGLAQNEEADLVVFGGWPYPNNEAVPEWIRRKLSPRNIIYNGKEQVKQALFKEESSRPFLWLHFIKRSLFNEPTVIRFNETMDLGEDQVLQFEYIPRAQKVVFTDKRFYTYRWRNEGSLMWTYYNKKITKFEKHIKIVENVFKNWNDEGNTDREGMLANWAVEFLYSDLINMPKIFRYPFAKQIVEIAQKYNHNFYMCNEELFDLGATIVNLSKQEYDYESMLKEDIDGIKFKVDRIEEQIQSTLKSKTFKCGRILTRSKDRLDIESVLPPREKKN